MGINGFSKFFSNILVKRDISELKNKIVIVDAIYVIYKYCIAIRNTGKDYVNNEGNLSSHLFAIFNISSYLLKNNITPIFVFDGKTPDIKKNTILDRKKKKVKAIIEINNMEIVNDNIEYIKNFKKSFHLEEIHYLECQLLLDSLGINYIIAPEEADSQCATLSYYNDKVAGIISDDTDILVFGGKKLIKNFNIKTKTFEEYSNTDILNFIIEKANEVRTKHNLDLINNISHKDFITYCILLGNDYLDSIKYLKYDRIFEILVLCDFDIIRFINYIKINNIDIKYTYNEEYLDNYLEKFNDVYNYYLNSRVFDNTELVIFNDFKINIELVEKIMCNFHNFSKEYIRDELNKIISNNLKLTNIKNCNKKPNNIKSNNFIFEKKNIFSILSEIET